MIATLILIYIYNSFNEFRPYSKIQSKITFYPEKKKRYNTNHTFLLNSLNTHKEHRDSIPRTFHLPQPPPPLLPLQPRVDRYIYAANFRRLTISHFQASPHDPGK